VVVHQRLRPVVRSFVDAGIVTPAVLPGFQAALSRALRLRNSLGVELTLIAFAPVILAQCAVLSGLIGARILFQGETLASFRYEIAAFVILGLAVVLGPLCVFAPTLLALKRQGRREYGALAARYTREFHEKWIRGGAPADEALVGSADIQSLADLANSYEVVRGMQAAPFGRDTVIQLAVSAVVPLLPLALTVLPAEEILKRLVGMLL
jgi:hypothetical protein